MTKPSIHLSTVVVHLLDFGGLALTAYLMERVFWNASRASLDLPLALVGAAGLLGAVISGDLRRAALDWPQGLYVGLAILSYAVSRSRYEPVLPLAYAWQPAIHLALLLAYYYAFIWLLRTPRRMAAVVTFLVVAMSAFGVMAGAEHVSHGLTSRVQSYVWLGDWGGYPTLGLLMLVVFPFPMAVVMVSGSPMTIAVSIIIAAVLVMHELLLYSRSGVIVMAAIFCLLALLEPIKLKHARLLATLPVFAAIFAAFWARRGELMPGLVTLSRTQWEVEVRSDIWHQAVALIRAHPWFGVGVGNYLSALVAEHPASPRQYFIHAHNMPLNVAAESGLPAALAFLWMWWSVVKANVRGRFGRNLPSALKIGCFGAVVAFLLRSMDDHFLSGSFIAERMSILIWTLLALATAVAATGDDGARAPDVYHHADSVVTIS